MIADQTDFLQDQLTQLETSYAEALAQDESPVRLTMIWKKIKELRQQIAETSKETYSS